jgi:hypothetical protein
MSVTHYYPSFPIRKRVSYLVNQSLSLLLLELTYQSACHIPELTNPDAALVAIFLCCVEAARGHTALLCTLYPILHGDILKAVKLM